MKIELSWLTFFLFQCWKISKKKVLHLLLVKILLSSPATLIKLLANPFLVKRHKIYPKLIKVCLESNLNNFSTSSLSFLHGEISQISSWKFAAISRNILIDPKVYFLPMYIHLSASYFFISLSLFFLPYFAVFLSIIAFPSCNSEAPSQYGGIMQMKKSFWICFN